MKKNLAIITSHPIQYQVPLFQKLNKSKFLNVTVFFGSKHGYKSKKKDLEFNKLINWNIKILEGYKFFFSKKEKDVDSFWLSFSQLKKKFTEEKIDKVLILGWNKVIYLQAIIISLRMGIPIYLRSENNLEKENTVLNRLIKKLLFNLFFKLFDKIFYIGKLNRYFYRYYGVSNDKLIFAPYFVDKNFFKSSVDINKIKIIKKKLNLYNNEKIILFVGKLIDRKNPFLFIEYAKKILIKCKFLIVGNGPLLKSLKEKIKKEKINNVILEASSHGLKQHRQDGLEFKTGIFSNLSDDHLDYHKNLNEYFKAKLYLFEKLLKKNSNVITDIEIPEYKGIKNTVLQKKLKM